MWHRDHARRLVPQHQVVRLVQNGLQDTEVDLGLGKIVVRKVVVHRRQAVGHKEVAAAGRKVLADHKELVGRMEPADRRHKVVDIDVGEDCPNNLAEEGIGLGLVDHS